MWTQFSRHYKKRGSLNLDNEINKIDIALADKEQISTIDVALVYNLCDKYIKEKIGVNILTIFEKINNSPEDITNYLIFNLYFEPKILNLISKYGISDLLAKTIYSMGDKKITISEQVIEKLKGIKCNTKNTSCPDQLAKALEETRN